MSSNNNNNNANNVINNNLSNSNKSSYKKSFEVQEYVDNFVNGNQQMTKWATTNPWANCDGDLIKYIPLKGSPKKTLRDHEGSVVYKQSPNYPARFQNAFESFESDTVEHSDKYERVRREMEKDENLKIVRITDPLGGEVHHSFHQLPLTATRSSHQLNAPRNAGGIQARAGQQQMSKSMMDIRFIDDGVDVTNSIKRAKAAVLDEGLLLGEKLLHPKRYNNRVGCSKQDTMREIMEPSCVECRKLTPFHKQMGVSFEGDDMDDKTTASLTSAQPQKGPIPQPGVLKQFLIDLKKVPDEFSCKRNDTINDGCIHQQKQKYTDKEQSQICNIL